jgi:hypothetical protein
MDHPLILRCANYVRSSHGERQLLAGTFRSIGACHGDVHWDATQLPSMCQLRRFVRLASVIQGMAAYEWAQRHTAQTRPQAVQAHMRTQGAESVGAER